MSMKAADVGRWNRRIGWTLLVAGFAWAAYLDPWSLSEHDPTHLMGSARMAARYGQAVVLGAAFLQLLAADLLTAAGRPVRAVAALTGVGAAVYAAGHIWRLWQPEAAWLIPAGALLNAAGFAVLATAAAGRRGCEWARVILPVLCAGMLLDAAVGLARADPSAFSLAFLGPEDGVRPRMLRLARAAVTALSLTAFLYQGLAARVGPARPLVRGGQIALWVGVLLMPTTLVAAAFWRLEIKYLLPIPALGAFVGVCVGVGLAARHGRPLEAAGWCLIAVSMGVGLFMGLYAFDGPLPSPAFQGAYDDWPRRLTRLGHAYCILFGLLSIFLARALPAGRRPVAGWLVAASGVVTILGIILVGVGLLPTEALTAGPAAVAVSTLLCLASFAPSSLRHGGMKTRGRPALGRRS